MIVKASLLCSLFCWANIALAQQNLVRNWSFEQVEPDANGDTFCFGCAGCVYVAEYWSSANSSPDYFNACSNEEWPMYGVPVNGFGCQRPYEGLAYALIAGYYEQWSGTDPREFVMQELEDSLKAGQWYRWSAWVSLADSVNFAQSGLGVKFTPDNTQFWDIEDFMACTPDVLNDYDNLLDDKLGWMQVEGTFQAVGGEKFMTIGLFRSDATDNIQRVDSIPPTMYDWDVSGYYLDAISLYEISGVGIQDQLTIDNGQLAIHPNPAGEKVKMTVQGSKFKVAEVVVIDHLGRSVLNLGPESMNNVTLSGVEGFELSVTDWPSGIYTVSVHLSDGTILHERLVVQHR